MPTGCHSSQGWLPVHCRDQSSSLTDMLDICICHGRRQCLVARLTLREQVKKLGQLVKDLGPAGRLQAERLLC